MSNGEKRKAVDSAIRKIAESKERIGLSGVVSPREVRESTGLDFNTVWNALRWLRARGLIGNDESGWFPGAVTSPVCWEHGTPMVRTADGYICLKCN